MPSHGQRAACQRGDYNPAILDGKHTAGITPPKSNWALPIDEPPYYGFVVTCGITFTFGGLRITTAGEVVDTELDAAARARRSVDRRR